jgi:hypothetical protein
VTTAIEVDPARLLLPIDGRGISYGWETTLVRVITPEAIRAAYCDVVSHEVRRVAREIATDALVRYDAWEMRVRLVDRDVLERWRGQNPGFPGGIDDLAAMWIYDGGLLVYGNARPLQHQPWLGSS